MTDIPAISAGRRAPRNVKLEKPAPLKRSISQPQPVTTSTNNTENTFQGVRAPRRTNLTKPLPRSKSTSEDNVLSENQSINQSINQSLNQSINQSLNQPITENQSKGMTPNTAKRTADCLIDDVLATLALQERSTVTRKPSFKTQMSVDSGVDDCNNSFHMGSFCIGRKNSMNDVLFDEGFNEYPDNILTIEEELSSLSNTETESIAESVDLEPHTVTEPRRPSIRMNVRAGWWVSVREPISPTTLLQGDLDMTGDVLTANGRRRMFQLYKNTCTDDSKQDVDKKFIQYSAEELLEIGTSPLSKRPLETWAYLVHILPHICFPTVKEYFDAALYRQEREYVVECLNVRDDRHDSGKHPSRTHSMPSSGAPTRTHAFSTISAPTTIPKPRTGFGTPSKTVDSQQPQTLSQSVEEVSFQSTFAPSTVQKPRTGFGTPSKKVDTQEPQPERQSTEEAPSTKFARTTNGQYYPSKTVCKDLHRLFTIQSHDSSNNHRQTNSAVNQTYPTAVNQTYPSAVNQTYPSFQRFQEPAINSLHTQQTGDQSLQSINRPTYSQRQANFNVNQNCSRYEDSVTKSLRNLQIGETSVNRPNYFKQQASYNFSQNCPTTFLHASQADKAVNRPIKKDTERHKQYTEGLKQYTDRNVDLDSKCDVSVKYVSGAIKLFAAARQDLKNSRDISNTIRLPTQVDGVAYNKADRPENSPSKPSRAKYYEEDFYFNADLPDKCPW